MPKIVCDPPRPEEQVEYYTFVGLPGNPQSPRSANPEYGCEHDVTDLQSGEYSLMVSACNKWKCSLATPFAFIVPEQPGQPAGFGIKF